MLLTTLELMLLQWQKSQLKGEPFLLFELRDYGY